MSQFRMSRRHLLFAAGLAPAALLAPRMAFAAPGGSTKKTLVCVFLRGGMDGLSAVVPYAEDAYYAARKQTAIPAPGKGDKSARKLDDQFGLHPALAPLMPAWQAGQLAFVHAVGSPHPTRSHFEAQDHFEWGGFDRNSRGGWLARAQAGRAAPASNLSHVALAKTTPLALRGAPNVVAARRLDQVGLQAPRRVRGRLESAFEKLYALESDGVARAGHSALAVAKRLRALETEKGEAQYPAQARGLSDVAQLIRADVGLEVAWVDAGGWDTHQGQAGRLRRNLDHLGRGLAAFREDIGDRMEHTLVLVMTEFGRTVKENGTAGTDHGHGSVMIAMGGNVNGKKVHGRWPGLAPEQRYQGRDLAVTTDFRDVFTEVLKKQLGLSNVRGAIGDYSAKGELGLLR